jgi:23S rRNA pseudouridine1911/1915/1917 synthase
MTSARKFAVPEDRAGQRTDVFVAQEFPQYTRSALRGLFEQALVLVNGAAQRPGDKLKSGDKVTVDTSVLDVEPEAIDLPIIFEDDNVIVINKPEGVLTHSKGAINSEATVASFIKPKIKDPNLTGNRAGIVHRLDRATSGIIIAAKTELALKLLQKQFSTHKVKKTYLAVAEGIIEPEAAIIDVPIERNPRRPQTFRAGQAGRSAQTKYTLIKPLQKVRTTYSYIKLEPVTGRTHQLRVHLAYVGHPIVGDMVYGNGSNNSQLLLHAASLEVTLPGGERKIFEAPLPKRINDFVS